MQTAGGGFAGAIGTNDQIVDYKVTITFPSGVQSSYQDVTKSVVSIDVQRSTTSTLPDGTSLIAGYATASATLTLSGFLNQAPGVALVESQSIYWLMNPADPTSPMYRTTRGGLPVVIQAGLWDGASSADLVTIFTGTIDISQCVEGVVTVVCRDQWSTLTDQATLPPVITRTPFNAGLTSEYPIDYLARHASPAQYLSWPAKRPGCVLAVSFRSSLWPEVGSYAAYTQPPEFAQGVFGTALTSNATSSVNQFTLAAPLPAAGSMFAEAFVTTDGVHPSFFFQFQNAAQTYGIQVTTDSGTHIVTGTDSPGGSAGSFAVSFPAGEHYVAFQASWPAGSSTAACKLTIDGTTTSFNTSANDTRDSSAFTLFRTAAGSGTVEGLQVTNESAPVLNNTFSPTLILDPAGSLNNLTALPDVTGQTSSQALQTIASAEAGSIYFDELGNLNFVNRQTIEMAQSVRSITSTTSLKALDSLEQMSLCATHVTQPVNALSVGSARTPAWNANTVIHVPGNSTIVVPIQTQTIVVNVDTTGVGFWPVGGPLNVTSFRACTTADGTGLAVSTGVTQTVSQVSPTQLNITIVNSTGYGIYMVSPASAGDVPAGTPFLFAVAQPVNSVSVVPVGGAVASGGGLIADAQWPPGAATTNTQFGEVLLQLPASTWVQDLESAQALVDDLLADLFSPVPLYRNVDIVADPRLQLLDRVTLIDPDVSQINGDALVIGIETQLSAGDWSQNIDARAFARPGSWVLGDQGFSELNSTTWIY